MKLFDSFASTHSNTVWVWTPFTVVDQITYGLQLLGVYRDQTSPLEIVCPCLTQPTSGLCNPVIPNKISFRSAWLCEIPLSRSWDARNPPAKKLLFSESPPMRGRRSPQTKAAMLADTKSRHPGLANSHGDVHAQVARIVNRRMWSWDDKLWFVGVG